MAGEPLVTNDIGKPKSDLKIEITDSYNMECCASNSSICSTILTKKMSAEIKPVCVRMYDDDSNWTKNIRPEKVHQQVGGDHLYVL